MGRETALAFEILNSLYVLKRGYLTFVEGIFGNFRVHLQRFATTNKSALLSTRYWYLARLFVRGNRRRCSLFRYRSFQPDGNLWRVVYIPVLGLIALQLNQGVEDVSRSSTNTFKKPRFRWIISVIICLTPIRKVAGSNSCWGSDNRRTRWSLKLIQQWKLNSYYMETHSICIVKITRLILYRNAPATVCLTRKFAGRSLDEVIAVYSVYLSLSADLLIWGRLSL
jgi:hypothetical protein